MHKRLLAAIGLFLLFGVGQAAEEVAWVTNYSQALEQAQREKKKLLIDFFSPT